MTPDYIAEDLATFIDCASTAWSMDQTVRYIRANQIPQQELSKAGYLAVIKCHLMGSDRFVIAAPDNPGGVPCVVVEVLDFLHEQPGAPISAITADLAAWRVDMPGEVRWLHGTAGLLGEWNADNPSSWYGGTTLKVHPTPLGWLQAACNGVAIVNRTLASFRFVHITQTMGPLACASREHALSIASMCGGAIDRRKLLFPAERKRRVA